MRRVPSSPGRIAHEEGQGTRGNALGLDRGRGRGEGFAMRYRLSVSRSFTLVELLVVITIIGLLAGLTVPAVGGAMAAARKAKVTSMANQIRTALIQFQTEYGYFPTNRVDNQGIGSTASELALILSGSASATNNNPRRIVFLEVPAEFTMNSADNLTNGGIQTPRNLYSKGSIKGRQTNFSISVDHDYDGMVFVRSNNSSSATRINGSCHVWIPDPSDPDRKTAGTWK